MMSINNTEKSKRGRPRADTSPVTVRLEREAIEAIDAHRREQSDIPTRPEVVRRALYEWLDANGYLGSAPKGESG
ncbi:ribbon-helix-helix domain-containing protein [Fodinicurvata sediminis]|uniref:ribbon-helix-helix domain-containing protein n=1 Tax=Fodinicurvata sediminis TaxID=1121832 RepID=UPI0004250623|nr:ribbon-helix-helix domain-containing protein [Fodinicurvata sediminis]